MSSFIRSSILLALAASVQAFPARRATEDHLVRDLRTLTKFAQTVTLDPNGTAATWTGTDVCAFEGITCADHPDGYRAVSGIDINGAELGENLVLDGLLDKLTDLTFFHANTNGFVGTVPGNVIKAHRSIADFMLTCRIDVSKLEFLFELDLSNNQLSGPFPNDVLVAPLTFLDLRFNSFSGELPPALFQSTDMDVIFLNDNQFSGVLPDFGNISTKYITLANNQFTGPIPVSIANVSGLKEILLLGNQFTGTIPEEICALDLDVLDVSDNQLDLTLGPECQALLDAGVLTI